MLVVDTSGLYALVDGDDPAHDHVAALIGVERGPFLLSPFVLQEVDYLVSERIGAAASSGILDDVASGAYQLEPVTAADVAAALSVVRRYADFTLGLADASIVVIAARHRTDRILTLDERHFRAVRPLQGGAFRVLPADA